MSTSLSLYVARSHKQWLAGAGVLSLCATVAMTKVTHGPHLQIAANQVTVHWETSAEEDSLVVFGLDPEQLTMRFKREELTTDHSVTVTGLAPATKYYYRFGSTMLASDGEALSVTTASSPDLQDTTLPADLRGRFSARGTTVLDNALGFTWTAVDNGSSLDWAAAVTYCDELALDGHDDWRLPTLAELERLYDARFPGSSCDEYLCRLPAGFALSRPWVWSSTSVNASRAYVLSLYEGSSYAELVADAGSYRALCVRSSR